MIIILLPTRTHQNQSHQNHTATTSFTHQNTNCQKSAALHRKQLTQCHIKIILPSFRLFWGRARSSKRPQFCLLLARYTLLNSVIRRIIIWNEVFNHKGLTQITRWPDPDNRWPDSDNRWPDPDNRWPDPDNRWPDPLSGTSRAQSPNMASTLCAAVIARCDSSAA